VIDPVGLTMPYSIPCGFPSLLNCTSKLYTTVVNVHSRLNQQNDEVVLLLSTLNMSINIAFLIHSVIIYLSTMTPTRLTSTDILLTTENI